MIFNCSLFKDDFPSVRYLNFVFFPSFWYTQDNSTENFKRANKILTADSEPVFLWESSCPLTSNGK